MASPNALPPDDFADRIVGPGPTPSIVDDDPDTAPVLRRRRPTVIPRLQGRRSSNPATAGLAEGAPTPSPADPGRSAHRKAWLLSAAAAAAIVMIATGIVLGVGHTSAATRPEAATAAASALPPATEGAGSITSASPAGSPGGPDDAATRTVAARTTSPSPKSSPTAPKKGLANPAGDDLALRRPVTASGSEGVAWSPAEAVDGDLTTRWSSAFADPQWIRIDLGALRQIKQVTLTWERSYAVAFRVQTSADGKTWKSVYRTAAGRGGTQTIKTPAAVGRYLRIYGTERVTTYGYSLFEIDVR